MSEKDLIPFLQRADEMQQHDRRVAYHCRMYALETGMAITVKSKELEGLLVAIITQLEKDKAVAGLQDDASEKEHLYKFAEGIWARADRIDRAGRADTSTAKTFYAASVFFEVCKIFGELPVETAAKQKYAAWKSADIHKAIKEGRTPTPGGAHQDAAEGGAAEGGAGGGGLASHPLGMPGAAGGAGPVAPPPAGGPPAAPEPGPGLGGAPGAPLGAQPPQPPAPAALAAPAAPAAALLLAPGQRVLFFDGTSLPEAATVFREVGEGTYQVACKDRVVTAGPGTLAPSYEGGEPVLYVPAAGMPAPATIVKMDGTNWPPSYVIRTADGTERDTEASRLRHLAPAPAAAPVAPPPPVETDEFGLPLIPTAPASADVYRPAAAPAPAAPPAPAAAPPAGPAQGAGLYPSFPGLSPAASPAPAPIASHPIPPAAPAPVAPAAAMPVVVPAAVPGYRPGVAAVTEAQKQTKFATSSLSFDDVPTAVAHLQKALALLTRP